MRALLAALSLFAAGCQVAEYTIGAAASDSSGCLNGQVPCGDDCADPGTCDDCPEGQIRCGDACVEPALCGDGVCLVGQVECDGECVPADTCPCSAGCDPEREICDDGVCRCREGLERCGSACADTRADPAHCGACKSSCATGDVCQDEECVEGCEAALDECAGACVDLASDSLHCGDCDKICSAYEVCVAGECREYERADDCDACPCPEPCEGEECCVDAPFLGAPVCVAGCE